MASREFIATSAFSGEIDAGRGGDQGLAEQSQRLMRLSLRFDPYSSSPDEDYERLREELKKFDIVSMLRSELGKSRIHISLTRKIISSLKYMDPDVRDDAAITLIKNHELLYPVFSSVLLLLIDLYDDLGTSTKNAVIRCVRDLIRSENYAMKIDVHLDYAIRLIGKDRSFENEELLTSIFRRTNSELVRRDIILVMARWEAWRWLSDLRAAFRRLSLSERRAMIIASYQLSDEGRHWRKHISGELTGLEKLSQGWASEKVQISGWCIPI